MPYDYLLIGQGLAGSLLGHFLEARGQRCYFLDAPGQVAASEVAAGIINPITGRRFVKSWRIDDLLPFATATYRQLEAELGIDFFQPRAVLRTLFNRGDENDWLARTAEPGFVPYLADKAEPGDYLHCTTPVFAYGEVRGGAQVQLAALTQALRQRWQAAGCWEATEIDYHKLVVSATGVRYRNLEARTVVCCEGWRMRYNPYFNYLPAEGNKGEALIVRLQGAAPDKILKHRVFLCPIGDGCYWVGATSDNHFADDAPSVSGRNFLEERLREVLQVPFEVLAHRAAVRPTVRDRRPLLGRHPEHPALAVFNGLGTKGASLGPYWANHLVAHLLDGAGLDPEVDIQRFSG